MTQHKVSTLWGSCIFAHVAPSPPSSGNSSIFIILVLGMGVVDPTVGLEL